MKREAGIQFRKITSLLLATAMVMGVSPARVYADEFNAVENVAEEVTPEEVVAEEVTPEEVVAEEVTPEEIVAEEVTPEEIVSEEADSEESEVEEADASDVADAEDGDKITLYDDYLISYLDERCRPKGGTENNIGMEILYDDAGDIYAEISSADMANIKSLFFTNLIPDNDMVGSHIFEDFDRIDYSELYKFTSVTSLEIFNSKNLKLCGDDDTGYKLPATLKSLIISGCTITSNINLSGASNLEDLQFTNNTFSSPDYSAIIGLRGKYASDSDEADDTATSLLKNLKTAIFDGSDISEIYFPVGFSNARPGLIFSAENCGKVEEINTGDYYLINAYDKHNAQYAPSFLNCSSLTIMDIKGIADVAASEEKTQTLEISGCNKLETFYLSYYFTDADNRLTINAEGITKKGGEFFPSRVKNSAEGRFILRATNNFLRDGAENAMETIPDLFDEQEFIDDMPGYIVFDQDYKRFMKMGLWKNGQSTYIRQYEANPVLMFAGQTIDVNTPHFLTAGGAVLTDIKPNSSGVKYEITNVSMPTAEELAEKNMSEEDYAIISVDYSTNDLKVTALNPGLAKFTVKYETADGSKEENQYIIVYNPVKSIEFNSTSLGDITEPGDYYFSSTLEVEYPSLAEYAAPAVELDVYNTDGSVFTNYTSAGLSVQFDSSKRGKDDLKGNSVVNGKVINTSCINVTPNMAGRQIVIKGKSVGNEGGIPLYKTNTSLSATIINVRQSDTIHTSDSESDVALNGKAFGYHLPSNRDVPSEIYIELPNLPSEYLVSVPALQNAALKNIINIERVTDTKYKVSFTNDSEAIAKFLENNDEFVVNVNVTKPGTDLLATFSKTIKVSGRFTVSYDFADGTLVKSSDGTAATGTDYYEMPYTGSVDWPFDKAATRYGYDFAGWYYGDTKVTGLNSDTMKTAGLLKGDITLVAHWNGHQHVNILKFDSNNGRGEKTIDLGKPVTFPNTQSTFELVAGSELNKPIDEAGQSPRVFAGWYTAKEGGTRVSSPYAVNTDNTDEGKTVTLYAHWIHLPVITQSSLTLSRGQIGINFYMDNLDEYVADGGYYVSVGDKEYRIISPLSEDGNCYTGYVNAKNMSDKIDVTVYRKEDNGNKTPIGVYYANQAASKLEYSVLDYCNYVLNRGGSDSDLYNLCAAIKNYGVSAQHYFGYNTDGLPGVNVDSGIDYSSYAPEVVGTCPGGVTYLGSSLLLENNVTIRHYFDINSLTGLSFTVNGNALSQSDIHTKDGCYYIDIAGINALDLDAKQVLTVSGGGKTYTIKYSALSYCQKVNSKSGDNKLKTLANSLYWYNKQAEKYFK